MDLDSAYQTWRCQGSSWLAQALSSNELPTPIVGLFHHKVETMSGVEDGNTIFGTRHVTRCWGVGWNSHNILHSNPKTSKTLEPWQCWWGKFDVRSCDTFNIHSHIPTSFNESISTKLIHFECFEMASAACTDGRTIADHIWLQGFHLDQKSKS